METGELTARVEPALPAYPLRKLIMAHYAHAMRQAAGEQSLQREELLGYLATSTRNDLRPLQAILLQTDAIGDPAMPEPPQVAILEWLGEAFELWQRDYPLEQPLADELRQLIPVAAALAVTDTGFLTPGQHPLHRLLDTIQDYAIGWQPSLGRAGNTLQKQLAATNERIKGWFLKRNVDLGATADELAQLVEREQSRAHRMTERLIATERGQQRAADARRDAPVGRRLSLRRPS